MRAPVASNIRGERTFVDVNLEKSIDKSQGNSYQPNKNVRSNTSTSQGSSSNSRAKCFNCGGFRHMSFQCPSKLVAMLEKDSPIPKAIMGSKQLEIQEEICEPLNANLKENVEDPDLSDVGILNFDDLDLNDEGMLGIIHPLLTAFNQDVQVNEIGRASCRERV